MFFTGEMKERDPNRLFGIYTRITTVHYEQVPDMRVLQFMMNFMLWVQETYSRDPFFVEDDELDKFINEYSLHLSKTTL